MYQITIIKYGPLQYSLIGKHAGGYTKIKCPMWLILFRLILLLQAMKPIKLRIVMLYHFFIIMWVFFAFKVYPTWKGQGTTTALSCVPKVKYHCVKSNHTWTDVETFSWTDAMSQQLITDITVFGTEISRCVMPLLFLKHNNESVLQELIGRLLPGYFCRTACLNPHFQRNKLNLNIIV